jgi:hypothetical protein
LATRWDSILSGGDLYGGENQENPEMRAMRRGVCAIPPLAEVLLGQMPVEELEPETSPVSESGQRWTVQIPQAAKIVQRGERLKQALAIRKHLTFFFTTT